MEEIDKFRPRAKSLQFEMTRTKAQLSHRFYSYCKQETLKSLEKVNFQQWLMGKS